MFWCILGTRASAVTLMTTPVEPYQECPKITKLSVRVVNEWFSKKMTFLLLEIGCVGYLSWWLSLAMGCVHSTRNRAPPQDVITPRMITSKNLTGQQGNIIIGGIAQVKNTRIFTIYENNSKYMNIIPKIVFVLLVLICKRNTRFFIRTDSLLTMKT